jgi:zinc protease
MLMRGTTTRTRAQLNDEFDRLKTRVSVSSTATAATASLQTTRANLPAALALLAEVLQRPAFTAAEFELAKQERLADLEEQSKEPTVLAQNALLRRIAPYETSDIRSYLTTEQMTAETRATTLEQARDFHRQFVGASAGELAVVGDFDSKEIAALTAKLFQNWKSRKPFTRAPRLYFDVPAGSETILTPDKANAFIMAGINLKLRDDDADYPAIALTNYLLGGGFLNSRLAMRLRQQDGFSYDAGSQLQVSSLDTTGMLFCYAIFAPQNAPRVEAGLREELQRLIKDGFSAAELEAAKPGWLQSRQVSRAQDNELTRALTNSLFLKRTLAWDAALEQKVTALTADEVNAVLRRHLSMDKLTIVKAGDFDKKQP